MNRPFVAELTEAEPSRASGLLSELCSFFRAAQACHVAANDSRPGGTAMRATLRIGPDGVPVDVEGAVALAPAGTEAEFGSCMRDALRATAWPCPRDDAPATVDVLVCQEPVERRR